MNIPMPASPKTESMFALNGSRPRRATAQKRMMRIAPVQFKTLAAFVKEYSRSITRLNRSSEADRSTPRDCADGRGKDGAPNGDGARRRNWATATCST